MDDMYRLLLVDLGSKASALRAKAKHARSATAKRYGDSPFADRCHTLADAHERAAAVYEQIQDEVRQNLLKRSKP